MTAEVMIFAIFGMVAAQVIVGLLLLSSITAMLRKAQGLLNVTASHAKMTDHTARCATVAVNELREDVKVAATVAKDVAIETATTAKKQLEESQKMVLVKLDSFRPPELSMESQKIAEKIEKVLDRRRQISERAGDTPQTPNG